MKIVNETKGVEIAGYAEYRGSFLGRFRGLMLAKRKDIILAANEDSIPACTIHMMHMLYPIDVIWVNSNMEVVDFQRDVKPFSMLNPATWRTYAPKKPAKYVVELATIRLGHIAAGDRISFID